ncbi:MAG: pyruvate kinase [Acidobacteriota bacterium]
MDRKAKIMATLGPASNDLDSIKALIEAGVNIVRFNLSHGTHDSHRKTYELVRQASTELKRLVPVVFDLMGPRYRIGTSLEQVSLQRDQEVLLSEGEDADLPIDSPGLMRHLRSGERVLIDNGMVELQVDGPYRDGVLARVIHGGVVTARKGINLPDSVLPFHISVKDREDIAFAIELGVDFIGASYVGQADHLERLRGVMEASGGELPLIAKLERAAAVENPEQLASIVDAADAVMVARGDLGVEVPLDQVPVLQKRIVEVGRRSGTPVIVATQMLESMTEQPRPTRAEVSDVANAVFDGADALMLSGETAVGKHPIEAVRTMDRTIRQAESYRGERARQRQEVFGLSGAKPGIDEESQTGPIDIPDAVSSAAAHVASLLQIHRIVAVTQGGFTARLLARYRPAVPVLVFTPDLAVARRVQLLWGIQPFILNHHVEHHDEVVELVDSELIQRGLAAPGEVVILLMGDPIRDRPRTNLMRVHRVRQRVDVRSRSGKRSGRSKGRAKKSQPKASPGTEGSKNNDAD